MVSFISIVHVVVKLKTFKVFRIDSASMKWPPFFWCVCLRGGRGGLLPSKYCSILLKFWPALVSSKKNIVFEKSFRILRFGSNETHPKSTALVHFGVQFIARKPKILPKTKFSAKNASLEISNNVSPRSEKSQSSFEINQKILVFGAHIGSKLSPWGHTKESFEILT